jgi:hypothetical protein
MRLRIQSEAHPNFAHGEPKAAGSGTARDVAASNHDGLLNPNRRWDAVRRQGVGRPTRNLRYLEAMSREVRRQRAGRDGQSSSSESNSSRGGLVGFPTGKCIAPPRVAQSQQG